MTMMTRLLTAAVLCILPATTATAAVQIVSATNGKLTGATGVLVDGTSYDVTFVDGNCVTLHGSCESAVNLDFSTSYSAQSAAKSLRDQVFIDTTNGSFDTNPALTKGCDDTRACTVLIPYYWDKFSIRTVLYSNKVADSGDYWTTDFYSSNFDSSKSANETFARFTLSPVLAAPVAAVPEPATWALMLAGFGLTGAAMRRRRRTATTRVVA